MHIFYICIDILLNTVSLFVHNEHKVDQKELNHAPDTKKLWIPRFPNNEIDQNVSLDRKRIVDLFRNDENSINFINKIMVR